MFNSQCTNARKLLIKTQKFVSFLPQTSRPDGCPSLQSTQTIPVSYFGLYNLVTLLEHPHPRNPHTGFPLFWKTWKSQGIS